MHFWRAGTAHAWVRQRACVNIDGRAGSLRMCEPNRMVTEVDDRFVAYVTGSGDAPAGLLGACALAIAPLVQQRLSDSVLAGTIGAFHA